jgi:hypothetical protein
VIVDHRTVLVLGAGASMDFGFPSGRELWQQIIGLLGSPESDFFRVLLDLGHRKVLDEFRRELTAARPPSVDVFLDDRREYLDVGKAAIACALIPIEQASTAPLFSPGIFSWYDYLYHRLTDGKRDDFSRNRLSIVTFNYDRSLEFFLFTTLKSRWRLTDAECAELLKAVQIVHIYGPLGDLAELSGGRGLRYGAALDRSAVEHAVSRMQILHEAADNADAVIRARKLLLEADAICFLGFGYHPTNLERLGVKDLGNRSVMGTAYGLLGGEISSVLRAFGNRDSIDLGKPNENVLLFLRGRPILV